MKNRLVLYFAKRSKLEVSFYMDGGLFETSYVKPTGGSIDNHRFYNTLHILDGSSRIATLRVGNNVDDHTPAITYIVGDHLNNSTAVLTTSGSLINREEYYPFGETSFGGFQYKRYRYNGKEKDEESGLYEYGQRYYAPWTCRFISVDPVAEDYPFYTPYNYAGNKPVSKQDIEGLQEEGAETKPKRKASGEKKGGSSGGAKETVPTNISPLPESVQDKIDEAIANGDDVKAFQQGDEYHVDIIDDEGIITSYNSDTTNEGPAINNELKMPENAEERIERQREKYGLRNDSPMPENRNRQAMEPMPNKPANGESAHLVERNYDVKEKSAQTGGGKSGVDKWGVLREGLNYFIDKTKKLLDWAGDKTSRIARGVAKFSKFLGWVSIIITVKTFIEDIQTKPKWIAFTKLAVGIGLAVAGIFLAATPIGWAIIGAGFIYGVMESTGAVDKGLMYMDRELFHPPFKYQI